jgi:VanZ family protein
VYASLQPFTGWRMPPDEVFGFLTAPWPRYITTSDIVLNVAAYLPFGAMLFVALRRPAADAATWLLASLIAGLLSLLLESVQMFLPARIASNLDLFANTAGAALGALAAWLCTLPLLASHPLAALRRRVVRADIAGDCGLIALAVWLFIQFDQAPPALASGDLRDALGLQAWFAYAPASYQNIEMFIAALAVLSVGLLAAQIATTPAMGALTAALILALTVTAKSAAMWSLARATSPFQWLTPGVMGGLLLGSAMLALLIWLPSAWRSGLAILCIVATVAMVNLSPENPYQAIPPFLLAPQPTHLSSFSNIVRALSQLWPFATIYLLLALTRRAAAAPSATGNSA